MVVGMKNRWIGAGLVAVSGALGFWVAREIGKRPEEVVRRFHLLYHSRGKETYNNTYWRGKAIQKNPLDLWVYQEILTETNPDVLVEAGTYRGGSAYYFASLFDLAGKGRVITVDIERQPDLPEHPRITYVTGSSTAPEVVDRIRGMIQPGERVMVALDSDHHAEHVRKELDLYHSLVTAGCYLVVEDTHFNGHPILPRHGPGPMEAAEAFLTGHPEFQVDRGREKFLFSFNYRGWLKRVR
jgi:cephalosporin hydroxylase